MSRHDGRADHALRPVRFTRGFTRHAEGSVLVEFGQTRVLCTATIEEGVPAFLRGKGQGWVTAEYGMLPRATLERTRREASAGKQNGRTVEIDSLEALRGPARLTGSGRATENGPFTVNATLAGLNLAAVRDLQKLRHEM